MGRKLLISLAMEGKFSAEGLQAVGDEDLLMTMARELVTEKGVGESATAVWRELQKRHDETFRPRQETDAMVPVEVGAAISSPTPPASAPLFTFGTAVAETSRRKASRRAHTVEDQLSLFGA